MQENVPNFKQGKDSFSSDEEEERSAPKPVLPSSMHDSDDEGEAEEDGEDPCRGRQPGEDQKEDERFLSSCTVQFRKAFEAEEEEDEYDRLAMGRQALGPKQDAPCDSMQALTGASEPRKPAGCTEVGLHAVAWGRRRVSWISGRLKGSQKGTAP